MRTRLVALLAAAALGAGGGVATALVDPGGGADGGHDGEPAFADPLNLGIPKVDLDCTGQPVLVVGYGDNNAALQTAIADNPAGEEVRYLDTSRSCDARWTSARSTAEPAWVAYVPGDRSELCLARLEKRAHQGDNVTFLVAGSEERAMCLCEVSATVAPVLAVGKPDATDPGNRIWIGELQDMLMTIDETRPDEQVRLTEENRNPGIYDTVMADRINLIRDRADLEPNGVLDAEVWSRIKTAGCGLYDYF